MESGLQWSISDATLYAVSVGVLLPRHKPFRATERVISISKYLSYFAPFWRRASCSKATESQSCEHYYVITKRSNIQTYFVWIVSECFGKCNYFAEGFPSHLSPESLCNNYAYWWLYLIYIVCSPMCRVSRLNLLRFVCYAMHDFYILASVNASYCVCIRYPTRNVNRICVSYIFMSTCIYIWFI